MKLSEAKEILRKKVEHGYFISPNEYPIVTARGGIEAINTVLKALDNSISKDDLRKKIDEMNPPFIGRYCREKLKELLGE